MNRAPLPVAVLVSGRGSNLQAILDAIRAGHLNARVVLVASDRPEAEALGRARESGVATVALAPADFPDRAAWNAALDEALQRAGAELVALAGFMRVLGPALVARWQGRILNIHPALLPKYRGLHTHRRVLEAGERMHGASVHFVTDELDGGPVVLQAQVPVLPADDEASLMARVQAREHEVYARVIGWFAEDRLRWVDGGPWLDERPLDRPVVV
jgi:phosphoribosylglycinamide formyltransferase-1